MGVISMREWNADVEIRRAALVIPPSQVLSQCKRPGTGRSCRERHAGLKSWQ